MKKKRIIAPARLILLIISVIIIGLFHCFRNNHEVMCYIADRFLRPLRMLMSFVSSKLPFSLAEMLIGVFSVCMLVFIVSKLSKLIHLRKGRGKQLYLLILTPLAWGMAIYAGFCMLWGVYYYGDDFMTKAHLETKPISTEQLETVTEYFAQLAGRYSSRVDRDYEKHCTIDRNAVLEKSNEVYAKTVKRWPCLTAPNVKAKGIRFSKVMSMIDFTGFFFPFTGEANVNMDSPSSYFPATVAHELAHLRGVAKEDEANFVAVIASMEYGDDDYIYSAALMAYTYLGNALRTADYNAWSLIYADLDSNVKRDLNENSAYWEAFKTPVETISNNVYEGFLQSYDQELGLKSYGACVDLLVDYYYDLVKPEEVSDNEEIPTDAEVGETAIEPAA